MRGGRGALARGSVAGDLLAVIDSGVRPARPVTLIRFPAGMKDGKSGFAKMDLWAAGRASGAFGSEPRDTIYLALDFQILGPSTDPAHPGRDFLNESVGTKLFYIAYGNTNRQNQSFIMLAGDYRNVRAAPAGTPMTAMKLKWFLTQMRPDGRDPGHADPQPGADVRVVVGRRYRLEMVMRMNSLSGAADGSADLWLDGRPLTHLTRLRFRSATSPLGVYDVRLDPVWGGDAGQRRSRDDYVALRHLYVSGR